MSFNLSKHTAMMIIKALLSTLFFLSLFGCSEHDITAESMMSTHKAMLKALCENDKDCHQKIDRLAESCKKSKIENSDFERLNDMEQMQTIGEFGVCIIRQMDKGFQNRFDQAIPVKETDVQISRPSTSINSNGLLVRVMKDGIRLTDKSTHRNTDMPLKNLKNYINSQKLAEKYSLVLLIVDKDADTGDMVEATDIFKSAGIEKIQIARGN